jgi:hypothetical protein
VAILPTYCNNLYVVAIILVAKAYFSSSASFSQSNTDGSLFNHKSWTCQEENLIEHMGHLCCHPVSALLL